jgi:hypothetical protein
MNKKQEKGKEEAIKALQDQIRKYERILRTKGEQALEEYKLKDSMRLTKLAEKRLAASLKKMGPFWYEGIDPERRKTVYDYWLEQIRFSHPGKEADFKAFLERGKRTLERIENRVDIHYVLWQLAQIAWGELEKPRGERVADKITEDYRDVEWDRERLLSSMDDQSRETITYRGIVSDTTKSGIRGKGAPPDTELNKVIVCLTEHFREKLDGPRWNTTAGLLRPCHPINEEVYFDQEKIKKRYKYWEKTNQSITSPIELYQSSLRTFGPFKKELKSFLTS